MNQQEYEGNELQSVYAQNSYVIEKITTIMSSQLPLNGEVNIEMDTINMTITRSLVKNLKPYASSQGSSFTVSSLNCSMLGIPATNCSNAVVVQRVILAITHLFHRLDVFY